MTTQLHKEPSHVAATSRRKNACIRVTPEAHAAVLKICQEHGMTVMGSMNALLRLWKNSTKNTRASAMVP